MVPERFTIDKAAEGKEIRVDFSGVYMNAISMGEWRISLELIRTDILHFPLTLQIM